MTNILVVGPHPDDQELGMGGSIARLADQGHNVLLLDMTNGEPTPHGDPETRAKEAARAADILGVKRRLLDLPNRMVVHSIEARHMVAGAIREHQAEIVFTPFFEDAHPDHIATTRIVEDARFDAKLTKIDLPGEPIYPKWLFYYYCTHLRWVANPNFLLDITGYTQKKRESILAYETQFVLPEKNRKIVDWLDASHVYYGSRCGTEAAEPFYTKEPLGLKGLDSLTMLRQTTRESTYEPAHDSDKEEQWGILRDEAERTHRLARIREPQVRMLNELVDRIQRDELISDKTHVPYIDPDCGGSNARILFLLQSPGPATLKSRFLSLDNRDQSAREVTRLVGEAGLNWSELVFWNIVPWYIPQKTKAQELDDAAIDRGAKWLIKFLDLCPQIDSIVTFGKNASTGWSRVQDRIGVNRRLAHYDAPHPSPQNLRTRPEMRSRILDVLSRLSR